MPYWYEIALMHNGGTEHFGNYESWVAAYQAIPGMFQQYPDLEWITIARVEDSDD